MHRSAPPPTPQDGAAGRIVARPPARRQLAGTVLVLEAVVVLFGTFAVWGLASAGTGTVRLPEVPGWTVWAAGLGLVAWFVAVSRMLSAPVGYWLGSLGQVVLVAVSLVAPLMVVVAVVFAVLWVAALRLGGRIDRERAAYDAAHPETAP